MKGKKKKIYRKIHYQRKDNKNQKNNNRKWKNNSNSNRKEKENRSRNSILNIQIKTIMRDVLFSLNMRELNQQKHYVLVHLLISQCLNHMQYVVEFNMDWEKMYFMAISDKVGYRVQED